MALKIKLNEILCSNPGRLEEPQNNYDFPNLAHTIAGKLGKDNVCRF
jgi:hypothetical protein